MERSWFARAFTVLMCTSMSSPSCTLMMKNLLPLKEQLVNNGLSFMHTTKSLSRTYHIVTILNVCKLGIREMFTKECKSLGLFFDVIGPCNFFTWQGGTPINKFPKPMFRKHHAHFELPKAKVVTIKLLYDFQGLHLKRKHFEHKCYKKQSSQKIKSFGRNL